MARVRRILAGDDVARSRRRRGASRPQLCAGCPHRPVFGALQRIDCIVAGDIGCYTLGVLPPFQAMDTCVCMGAASAWAWACGTCCPRSRPAGW